MTKIKQNNIESFSQKTIKAIKYYVYALVNPKTENIFYIGKGSKNRCFKSWKEQNNVLIGITYLQMKNQINIYPQCNLI